MGSLCVIATYGNVTQYGQPVTVRWCSGINKQEDADTLRDLAISKGFADAEIWEEKEYRAHCAAKQRAAVERSDARRRW